MKMDDATISSGDRVRKQHKLRLLFAIALIWGAPTLACGSFATRPTPTPTLPVTAAESTVEPTGPSGGPVALQTPILPVDTDTPTPEATATFTPTPIPGTALAIGQPARVVAPNGVNMRAEPSTSAALVRYLPSRLRVTVVDGPSEGEGYRWWKLDDGEGNIGWSVENDGDTDLLSPQMGEVEPVDRSPRVGERVRVTMSAGGQLSVRETPGTDARLLTRVSPGQEFTVTGGPQESGGYTWFQIRSDSGDVEGWAAEADRTERWLSPLE
jgi:SH3-like domain-containing protein